MRSDTVFTFGKYMGISLKDAYTGSENIDRDFIKEMLLDRLLLLATGTYGVNSITVMNQFFRSDLEYEISHLSIEIKTNSKSNRIKLKTFMGDLERNTKLFDYLMSPSYTNRDIGIIPTSNANPGYIFWCLKNIEDFYIDPIEVELLENLNLFYCDFIEFNLIKPDLFGYKTYFSKRTCKFPTVEKALNQKKFNRLAII